MSKSFPIQTKVIYAGKIIDLSLVTAVLPNGRSVELEIIEHPGGAAVVAVNQNNQVCLIRQYRYVVQGWLWELPAGKIDNKEDPRQTAIRELKEETGVIAKDWQSLGTYMSSPGVFSEIVHLFLAKDIECGALQQEDDEVIEVHWVDLVVARQWVLDNTISDGKSAVGLLRAYELLSGTHP